MQLRLQIAGAASMLQMRQNYFATAHAFQCAKIEVQPRYNSVFVNAFQTACYAKKQESKQIEATVSLCNPSRLVKNNHVVLQGLCLNSTASQLEEHVATEKQDYAQSFVVSIVVNLTWAECIWRRSPMQHPVLRPDGRP